MRDVAGLFVQKAGEPLRTLLVFKSGYWFFPGGKREEGETLYEALAREIFEELGLFIGCMPPLIDECECISPINRVRYRFHTYMCNAEQLIGVPRLRRADTVKDWVWVDKPLELNLTTHARLIIQKFGQ